MPAYHYGYSTLIKLLLYQTIITIGIPQWIDSLGVLEKKDSPFFPLGVSAAPLIEDFQGEQLHFTLDGVA